MKSFRLCQRFLSPISRLSDRRSSRRNRVGDGPGIIQVIRTEFSGDGRNLCRPIVGDIRIDLIPTGIIDRNDLVQTNRSTSRTSSTTQITAAADRLRCKIFKNTASMSALRVGVDEGLQLIRLRVGDGLPAQEGH